MANGNGNELKPPALLIGLTKNEAASLHMILGMLGLHEETKSGLIHTMAHDLCTGAYFPPEIREREKMAIGDVVDWVNDLKAIAGAIRTWIEHRATCTCGEHEHVRPERAGAN